jgi:cation:H+ antiporter
VFVRGVVGLALWTRDPAGLVGVTVAAFATSGPELSVGNFKSQPVIRRARCRRRAGISRFLAGYAEVGLGTVLGSNIFSNLWIVGVAATLSPAALGAAKCGSQLWTAW